MASPPQTPIQIHIPPSLQQYTVPLTQYLASHTQYTNLVVSSLIFDTPFPASSPAQPPRLLLVQRAAHERAFGNLWETPGGSSDATDPTILHSAAREVFEETGLMLTRFVRQVGGAIEFQTGKAPKRKNWVKLSFEIQVAEIAGHDHRGDGDVGGNQGKEAGAETENPNGHQELEDKGPAVGDGVAVMVDPEEHQAYAWVSEDEIKGGKYPITTPQQRVVIMQAFGLRSGDVEQARILAREPST